jgi:release factor glutamine methyltransferase
VPEVGVSVREAIRWATGRLGAAGIEAPRREAVRLWSWVAGVEPARLAYDPDRLADSLARARFREAVARRERGMPAEYAVGSAGFRRLTLRADPRALIPRPETEGLVDRALALMPSGRALDLGTGSGCVALSLRHEGAYDAIVGVDASGEALALARENAAATRRPVEWVQGDWCAPLAGGRFDLVVSNPPYLTTAEVEGGDPAVIGWEPHRALDGGADGLAAIRRIVREAPAVVRRGGVLVMEVDANRAAAAARLAEAAGWAAVRVTQDLFGRDRYVSARRESDHA